MHLPCFLLFVGAFTAVAGRPAIDTVSTGSASVRTAFGTVTGESISKGLLKPLHCEQFRGIPYAQAPTGMRRWVSPMPWNETYPGGSLNAIQFGAVCPQEYLNEFHGEEDCLFLNVWRPAGTTEDSSLPLMIWIHGGAFVQGSGADAVYDGCSLASNEGVIVVTLNYRLGPLGFVAFQRPGRAELEANFGIQDQRAGIRWIRKQARAFGGDAEKVTIFGESAGGISVFHHVASPLSHGLFRAAIAQSGIPSAVSSEFAMNRTLKLAQNVGCQARTLTLSGNDVVACMMNKSAAELILGADEEANPFTTPGWSPAIDGIDMVDWPLRLFESGKVNPVTLMAGTNTDEGNAFVYPQFWKSMDENSFRSFIPKALNSHDPKMAFNSTQMEKIFTEYPPSSSGDNRPLAGSLLTDATFLCGTELSGQYFPGSQSFYEYRFNHRAACLFKDPIPGVHHALEITFVFGTSASAYCVLTPEETELSRTMQNYWAALAKNLDPGFPRFTNGTRRAIVLQTPKEAVDMNYRGDKCKFWEIMHRELQGAPMRHSAADASTIFV